MATSTPGRKAVAAAARALMSDKIKAVEILADAIAAHQAAQAEIDQAIERANAKAATAREKYDTARAAGWTIAELRNIGLEAPTAPRRRRDTDPGASDTASDTSSDTNSEEAPADLIDISSPVPAPAGAQPR